MEVRHDFISAPGLEALLISRGGNRGATQPSVRLRLRRAGASGAVPPPLPSAVLHARRADDWSNASGVAGDTSGLTSNTSHV